MSKPQQKQSILMNRLGISSLPIEKKLKKTAQENLIHSNYVDVFEIQAEALHSLLNENVRYGRWPGTQSSVHWRCILSRPPGNMFWIGNKVFIYSKSRNQPERRQFLFFGVFGKKTIATWSPSLASSTTKFQSSHKLRLLFTLIMPQRIFFCNK